MTSTRSRKNKMQDKTPKSPPQRRSTRSRAMSSPTKKRNVDNDNDMINKVASDEESIIDDDDVDDEHGLQAPSTYVLDGVEYATYQEMVNAKRKRNEQVLQGLGFLENDGIGAKTKHQRSLQKQQQRGIKKQKLSPSSSEPVQSRKSSRLSGQKAQLVALDYNVNNWNRDTTVVQVEEGDDNDNGKVKDKENDVRVEVQNYFKGRVNDGSDLTLEEAIDLNEPKWVHEHSVERGNHFQKELAKLASSTTNLTRRPYSSKSGSSPTSVMTTHLGTMTESQELQTKIANLSIEREEWVAKVTPERIYRVATHPSEDKLIACAGDKLGYVGIWDVDGKQATDGDDDKDNNGVHLFRIHSQPVCGLEWASSNSLITASYDGTIRRFDTNKGIFEQIFASYDDSDSYYAEELGYGLDQGYSFWHQNVTIDHRYKGSPNPCLFLSTSLGTALHLDLRVAEKQKITFHERLSEKKINTLSLHPNGHTLASAGLDGVVRLWDLRKFGAGASSRGSSTGTKKVKEALAAQHVGLSISSSYFSPSGNSLLTTSFANRLDMIENPHLVKGTVKPTHSIPHNNQTGRWLSTFMATWHPQIDIFVTGSMNKPRCMEIFDSKGKLLRAVTGEALGSVMSRCSFHPSADKLIMIGGNSSGRVVAVR